MIPNVLRTLLADAHQHSEAAEQLKVQGEEYSHTVATKHEALQVTLAALEEIQERVNRARAVFSDAKKAHANIGRDMTNRAHDAQILYELVAMYLERAGMGCTVCGIRNVVTVVGENLLCSEHIDAPWPPVKDDLRPDAVAAAYLQAAGDREHAPEPADSPPEQHANGQPELAPSDKDRSKRGLAALTDMARRQRGGGPPADGGFHGDTGDNS